LEIQWEKLELTLFKRDKIVRKGKEDMD